ncbi:DEAD/DEAH box helicase [Mesorhizobium sp. L2C089B000]|uniref:DEAD/DEAH box helicase n=2 Tax=unclassified Mesorhizobium TaxID=325217 RepID=UPI0018DD8EDB|nr:DEAD/DEAH box helicase [Mesorhizobium sp. L2C089B000]
MAELEKLFDHQRDDPDFLKVLIAELSERTVPRAQELKRRAIQAVGTNSRTAPQQRNHSQNQDATATVAVSTPGAATPLPQTDVKEYPLPEKAAIPLVSRPALERPPITNKAADVLSTWTAMEVLSPPSFRKPEDLTSGDRSRIAPLDKPYLPWENKGERSRPKQKLYYQIILGSVDMEAAISALLQVYTDSRIERPAARGEAVLATIMVDREGRPVEDDCVAISSFGWGMPVALAGRLSDLGTWSQVERHLVEELSQKVVAKDKEGRPKPLTRKSIEAAHRWLVVKIGIDSHFTKAPAFAVRSYQYFKLQDPPEAILLNSFFLEDLARAQALVADGKATGNFKRYIGTTKPKARRNLMSDNRAIADALEPAKFPLGSWPGNGRHPLAMLQQCAVNLTLHDLKTEGIVAVNGPPGTGKTTLLRDVVAAIVTNRAELLCSFSDPKDALSASGQKLKRGNSFIHLYKLDDKLRGHEIIVASSNNKAVENVSAELPGMGAIAEEATGLRYFKTVSDALLGRDSWGVIAAVLGNARNRSDFRQTFWWDEDVGFQRYLQQASGNPQLIEEKTETGTRRRPPRIVAQENAPEDHDEALRRWGTARLRFTKALAQAKTALTDLQEIHDLLIAFAKGQVAIATVDSEITSLQPLLERSAHLAQAAALLHQKQRPNVETLERDATVAMRSRPGFLGRLFRTAAYRRWQAEHGALLTSLIEARSKLALLKNAADAKSAEHSRLAGDVERLRKSHASLIAALEQNRQRHASLVRQYPGTSISEDFFERRHADKQKTAPWLDEKSARLRNDVFEAAMALHRAFVDAAAQPIRHNLNALMDGFGTRSLGSEEKDALIPHLWSTLFLLVPVVSTTFASVSRMFPKIGPEEFGWLLVDEAGQALPQAAVGALIRTKRAVVVGDPIQIEPVVVLPDQLTEAMCHQFGVDPLIYCPPGAPSQTLADSATEYYGTFETKFGTREVGVPLLVHRRCEEPMFSISNSIAYENLMVQAKTAKTSAIRDVLGPSCWIDVEGRGQEKWCPQEGEMLLGMLRQLRQQGVVPDFYIVTPFVVVQDRIREMLRSSGLLDEWVENPFAWVYERVGTVHTVQGREAEAVFFVLGAPNAEQRGARGWAGGRPNLLNVAVTRAKEAVYIIGNRTLWKSAGVFQSLDKLMP